MLKNIINRPVLATVISLVLVLLGIDPDQAAVNVQNRVAQVNSQIPAEVVRAGITTRKQQNSNIMFFNIMSRDSVKYNEIFLQNYAKIKMIKNENL